MNEEIIESGIDSVEQVVDDIDYPLSVPEAESSFEVVSSEPLDDVQSDLEEELDIGIASQLVDDPNSFLLDAGISEDSFDLIYKFTFGRPANTYQYVFDDDYDSVLVFVSCCSNSDAGSNNYSFVLSDHAATLVSSNSHYFSNYFISTYVYRFDNVRVGDTFSLNSTLYSYAGTCSLFKLDSVVSDQPDYLKLIYEQLDTINTRIDSLEPSTSIKADDLLNMSISDMPADVILLAVACLCFMACTLFNFILKRF